MNNNDLRNQLLTVMATFLLTSMGGGVIFLLDTNRIAVVTSKQVEIIDKRVADIDSKVDRLLERSKQQQLLQQASW